MTGPEEVDPSPPDYRFEVESDLRYIRGYVINRWTGEVLSSVIADVMREQRAIREAGWQATDAGA